MVINRQLSEAAVKSIRIRRGLIVEFAFFPHVFSLNSLTSSHSPETSTLGSDSKLGVGVNMSMNGCLALCVSDLYLL